jgi:hypothetical protein
MFNKHEVAVHRSEVHYLPNNWIPTKVDGEYAIYYEAEKGSIFKLIEKRKGIHNDINGVTRMNDIKYRLMSKRTK